MNNFNYTEYTQKDVDRILNKPKLFDTINKEKTKSALKRIHNSPDYISPNYNIQKESIGEAAVGGAIGGGLIGLLFGPIGMAVGLMIGSGVSSVAACSNNIEHEFDSKNNITKCKCCYTRYYGNVCPKCNFPK